MAATNTIDTVTVRGVSEGLDKLASDLDKVRQAQDNLAKAGEETAKVFDKPAPRQLDVGKAFERLTAQIDPAFRAQQQMARGQAILDRAFEQGKIDADQYAASLEKLRARFGSVGAANNNLLSQTGNLAAQFNDIAVQLAAGTSPLTIAVQQGTQIAQVLGDAPGGARGAVAALGGAFMSLISPVNLLTIGAIAAGGALIQYFTSAGEKVETLDDRLKAHSDLIRSIKESYGEAAQGLDDYAGRSAAVFEVQLRAQMERLKGDVQRMSFEIFNNMMRPTGPAFTDPASGIGFGGVNLELDPKYKAFESAVARLNELTATGAPNIRGYVEELARIAKASDSTQIRAMADELINKADGALKAQEALERDARAVGILGDSIAGNIGSVREFTSALNTLAGIALPKLSDFERIAELRKKALTDPIVTPDMVEAIDRESMAAEERARQREREKQEEEARRKAESEARRAARGAQADEDAFGRAITTAQGRTRQIEEEIRLFGQYGGELEAARLRIELETAAKKRGLDITDDMRRAIDAEVSARRAAVEQLEAVRERQEALNQSMQYFGDLATDALSDLFIEGKSVEDVFNNIAKSIANAALQAALMGQGPLAGLFGLQGQNGAPGGLFGALFSGLKTTLSANGNIMTDKGPLELNTYANGGIARSPQISIFGEGRTPEAYVPLPDGRSIPVAMQGPPPANSNRPMQVVINNNTGAKVTATERMGPNGPSLQVQIDDMVANALLSGSRTAGALKQLRRNQLGG